MAQIGHSHLLVASAAAARGADFYRANGSKGGTRTRENHGREHFQAIGRKGGRSMAEKHGAANLRGTAPRAAPVPVVGLPMVLFRRQDDQQIGAGIVENVHDDGTCNVRVVWDNGNPPSLLAAIAHRDQAADLQHAWFYWAEAEQPQPEPRARNEAKPPALARAPGPVRDDNPTAPKAVRKAQGKLVPKPKAPRQATRRPRPRPEPEPVHALRAALERLWAANGGQAVEWLAIAVEMGCSVTDLYGLAQQLRKAGMLEFREGGVAPRGK